MTLLNQRKISKIRHFETDVRRKFAMLLLLRLLSSSMVDGAPHR